MDKKKTKFPMRVPLNAKKPSENRPAREPTQRDLDRQSRMQGMEAKEAEMMMKTKKPKKMAMGGLARPGMMTQHARPGGAAAGVGMARPTMMAKGGKTCADKGKMKKYAKGGSIDGCAMKGKTKGKMY